LWNLSPFIQKVLFDFEDLKKNFISWHNPLKFIYKKLCRNLTLQEWVCEQPAAQEEAVVAPEQDYGVPLAPVLPPVQEYGAPQVSQHLTHRTGDARCSFQCFRSGGLAIFCVEFVFQSDERVPLSVFYCDSSLLWSFCAFPLHESWFHCLSNFRMSISNRSIVELIYTFCFVLLFPKIIFWIIKDLQLTHAKIFQKDIVMVLEFTCYML
jgi:hypothetical protein